MKEYDELNNEDAEEEEYEIITISDDDGNEVDYVVISTVEMSGTNYLLVLEDELFDDDEADASILKEISEEGENIVYTAVEDDDEFTKVVKLFQDNNDDYDIEV